MTFWQKWLNRIKRQPETPRDNLVNLAAEADQQRVAEFMEQIKKDAKNAGVKSEVFRMGDVYIDFRQEEVMFRWEKATQRVFRKFYGDKQESDVPHTNNIFCEARLIGRQITMEEYLKGKERRSK